MKINPEKSQVLLSSNIQRVAPFCNAQISSSTSEKLLGTSFTQELKFEEHISKIWNIINKRPNARHHITNLMNLGKQKCL